MDCPKASVTVTVSIKLPTVSDSCSVNLTWLATDVVSQSIPLRSPTEKVMVRVSEPEVAVKVSSNVLPYFFVGVIAVLLEESKRNLVALKFA